MGDLGGIGEAGIGEARERRLEEAGGGFAGGRTGFGGGNSQPSVGKNISNQELQAQISALQAQFQELAAQNAAISVHALTAQHALLSTENASLKSANESLKSANDALKSANDSLKAANESMKPANETLKSANESLTAEVARLTQQSNNRTCPTAATIPDLASIDMNVIMQLSPSQLNTLDAGLRRVRTRILATTDDKALRRLVENEVPLLLMSVGVAMDLYVGTSSGWNDFCDRKNSSQFRMEALYSRRRKNVENFADWTSYAMIICLDVFYKLCLWRNIS